MNDVISGRALELESGRDLWWQRRCCLWAPAQENTADGDGMIWNMECVIRYVCVCVCACS